METLQTQIMRLSLCGCPYLCTAGRGGAASHGVGGEARTTNTVPSLPRQRQPPTPPLPSRCRRVNPPPMRRASSSLLPHSLLWVSVAARDWEEDKENEWLIQGCYPYWRPLLKACNSLQQKRPGAPGSRFIKPWRHCFKSLGTYLDIEMKIDG